MTESELSISQLIKYAIGVSLSGNPELGMMLYNFTSNVGQVVAIHAFAHHQVDGTKLPPTPCSDENNYYRYNQNGNACVSVSLLHISKPTLEVTFRMEPRSARLQAIRWTSLLCDLVSLDSSLVP